MPTDDIEISDDDVQAQLQELRDIEAIKRLKARYVRHVDAKEWDTWGTLLSDDFYFDAHGRVYEGRDQVVAVVRDSLNSGSTVHHVYNPEIVLTGPDTAEGIWPMESWVRTTVNGSVEAFHGFGHYREDYVRTADGWRISKSVLTRLRTDPIEHEANG